MSAVGDGGRMITARGRDGGRRGTHQPVSQTSQSNILLSESYRESNARYTRGRRREARGEGSGPSWARLVCLATEALPVPASPRAARASPQPERTERKLSRSRSEGWLYSYKNDFLEHVKTGDVLSLRHSAGLHPEWIHLADDNGISAIHHAAFAAHPGVVGFLLDKKASLHSRDCRGWTPMHFACSSANPMFLETVELMSARAEEEDKFALVMRQQSHNGSTPLHCLARNVAFPTSEESRFIGAVTHIVSANCISLRNRRGRTALHVAAAAGNTPAVVALQAVGMDMNDADKEGYTPLHLCIMHSAILDTIKVLILFPANLRAPSPRGTCIEIAKSSADPQVQAYFASGAYLLTPSERESLSLLAILNMLAMV